MSITTYQELKDAVIAWPDLQGEVDLAANVDTCISLGEARINQLLRLQGHLVTVSVPDPSRPYELPTDCMEIDRVAGSNGQSLEMRPADEIVRYGIEPATECFYAIDGRQLLFSAPVAEVTLRYYKRSSPLIDTDSNWLFAADPGLYLYAALIEVAVFSKQPDTEAQRYQQAFESAAVRALEWDAIATEPRSQPLRSIPRTGRKATPSGG